jgi:glycosyltransferase involved in cell wall biosynthesis
MPEKVGAYVAGDLHECIASNPARHTPKPVVGCDEKISMQKAAQGCRSEAAQNCSKGRCVDQDYFVETILPILRKPHVEFIGEITDAQKPELLSGALALIMPIDWPEPFGLVMIEAMACGTPVIAFNRGSVPEVIEDGLTGFVVEDETSAVGAIRQLSRLSAPS